MDSRSSHKTAGPHRLRRLRDRLTWSQSFDRMERIIGRARKAGRVHRLDNGT